MRDPPELRSPVLVAAFAGWNDAAERRDDGARGDRRSRSRPSRSPRSTPRSSTTSRSPGRRSGWPRARPARSTGPTTRSSPPRPRPPSATWCWSPGSSRTCAGAPSPSAVIEAAERLDVEMVVTLGALLADVPHTRPVPITGLASDPELVERLALSRSSYEGPDRDRRHRPRRLPPARADLGQPLGGRPPLRRRGPEPEGGAGAAAPARGLHRVAIEASELEEAMERFETQVDRAVAANPEIEELVRRLESEQAEEQPRSDARTCPRATRSPRTSSASCASERRERAPSARGPVVPVGLYASLAGQIRR